MFVEAPASPQRRLVCFPSHLVAAATAATPSSRDCHKLLRDPWSPLKHMGEALARRREHHALSASLVTFDPPKESQLFGFCGAGSGNVEVGRIRAS